MDVISLTMLNTFGECGNIFGSSQNDYKTNYHAYLHVYCNLIAQILGWWQGRSLYLTGKSSTIIQGLGGLVHRQAKEHARHHHLGPLGDVEAPQCDHLRWRFALAHWAHHANCGRR